MVLRDNLNGKMVFLDLNIRIVAHSLHQATLYLGTCIIGVMQDAELGVSTFTVQVELAIFLAVEVNPPLHQFLDLSRCIAHHLFYCLAIADG